MPGIEATDPAAKRAEAERWCDRFEESTRRWLKSTIAACDADGNPEITYQDIDTSLIPPRPRLYGLVGAESIEEVWKDRQASAAAPNGHGKAAAPPMAAAT
jgi:succinate dehydrogenase / fumarate reductase flavoprotein subunit